MEQRTAGCRLEMGRCITARVRGADRTHGRWDKPIGSLRSRVDYSLFAAAPRRPPVLQKLPRGPLAHAPFHGAAGNRITSMNTIKRPSWCAATTVGERER